MLIILCVFRLIKVDNACDMQAISSFFLPECDDDLGDFRDELLGFLEVCFLALVVNAPHFMRVLL